MLPLKKEMHMNKLVRQATFGALLGLALLALPADLAAQPLPTPKDFVNFLDLRCYRIPNQPPLNVPLQLDHLNPVLRELGAPTEHVWLQEPEDLCVPVRKNDQVIPSSVLPFLRFADLKCYRITGPPLNLPLHIDQLNPEIAALFGPSDEIIVREPEQLCVPVAKNNQFPPPDVLHLIQWLDLKCYRVEATPIHPAPIKLKHLNPLFANIPQEEAWIDGPAPIQLCVPVAKNERVPPDDVLKIIEFSDTLCYNLRGLPLNKNLKLDHLNPVLRDMGLPPEFVWVTDSHKLCVPVAKNGMFPPS
jgi:hypothetical protein